MIGVVQARELLAALLSGERLDIRSKTRVAPIIPETTDALDVLNVLRTSSVPVALVHDEYGHFMGLVTPADVLEVISGVFKSHAEDQQPLALQRDDGAWVLAGGLPVDEMAERLGIAVPAQRGYETVAGFVLAHLQHIPAAGEHFIAQDWRFDVTKLNGNRIGAVLATRFIGSRRTYAA
jgi:putative hemolysin